MTPNASTKKSTHFWKLKQQLYRLILKRSGKDRYIDDLVTTAAVVGFGERMTEAIAQAMRTIPDTAIQTAVLALTKADQDQLRRVKSILEAEYGSVDEFISRTAIESFLADMYQTGGQHVLDKLAINASFTLKNPDVLRNLEDRANYLIKTVDETTKDRIASFLTQGVANNQSWQEIATTLSQEIPKVSQYRGELIARMETANAVNTAELDFYRKNGLEQKEWVLASSHSMNDVCDDNADAGLIGVNDSFPSGDDAPPGHVNCMCTINTVIPDDFITNGPTWLGE